MTRKTYFGNYEKVSKIWVECNVGKNYDCMRDLFFGFEEALLSFKLKNFD